MGERVLSWGELNRALLARQLLLERARTGPARAVERVGGLQTQYAPSGYVGLWSRRFRDPAGGELVDLPRLPVPAADTPAPVRFLSTFDAVLLLGHATRAGILPAEHREKVFATRMPQSTPTFLVDGRVAGTWRFTDGRVVPAPFAELPAAVVREVGEEAERLTEFHVG